VAGDGADSIGKQSGGWTLSWQGNDNKNADFPGGHLDLGRHRAGGEGRPAGQADAQPRRRASAKPDVAIVVFGEDPYAEFQGDRPNLGLRGRPSRLALLKRLKAQGVPVVAVFLSGRPLWVNPEINASDAFVAAWLPGSKAAGVADVLFARPERQAVATTSPASCRFPGPSGPTSTG
jgi:beta-glucosidase